MMPKAILENGVIRPLEPLPPDWRDGQELRVEKVDDAETLMDEIDHDFSVLADLCSRSDPDDEATLARALQGARQLSKEQVRRSMVIRTGQTRKRRTRT